MYVFKIIPVLVLDEFPEWLQRSSIDHRIKDTNTKLKRIAKKKKEPVSVSGHQQQEGKEEKPFRRR
jgi:hypothetical protein